MRVAFIVDKFPNISETFILDEIVGMIDAGNEVDIYALARGTARDVHPAYAEFNLAARTFYGVPDVPGRIGRLLAAVPPTIGMLRRRPATFLKLVMSRENGIQTRTLLSLARAFVNGPRRYDVVHAHFGPNGVRAAAIRRAGAFDAPFVTTFHGYDATSFVRKYGNGVYRKLAVEGDCFIAVSRSIVKALGEIGIPQARTVIKPLGVDCGKFFAHRLARAGGGTSIRVLSIGRFVEKKGLSYGIRAVAEAHRTVPALTYDIVGDGALRAELEALISELGAGAYIRLLGYRDQEAVSTLLSGSDIMLVPSITATDGDQESMPIVVKEAMACALPVIATRHAGIPEIVEDGITGLLSDERDVHAMATHIVRLASDEGARMAMGSGGRRVIELRFDNKKLIEDLVALYHDMCAKNGRLDDDRSLVSAKTHAPSHV